MKYIYGCLFGGWCGDAIGGVLEFINKYPNEELIYKAIHMSGGGILKLGPGQITDDSELEISCLNALRHFKPSNNYPLESVANEYLKWFKSKPFDIGKTCMNAFYNAENVDTIINNSNRYNMASLANGALMRAAGIAV